MMVGLSGNRSFPSHDVMSRINKQQVIVCHAPKHVMGLWKLCNAVSIPYVKVTSILRLYAGPASASLTG